MNQTDLKIGFSIEDFNHHCRTKGQVGLGVFDNSRSPGTLIDIHTEGLEPRENRNGNQGSSIEVLCAQVTQRLFSELEDQVYEHPKFLQFEELAESVLDKGWDEESQELMEVEIARAVSAKERTNQMYLAGAEWTEQTAIADHLLQEGTALYLDALLSLSEALDDSEVAVEESLAWLSEGVFFLMAVQKWRSECE